jgi:hypothetical protein
MYIDMQQLRASQNGPKIAKLTLGEKDRVRQMKDLELAKYRQ